MQSDTLYVTVMVYVFPTVVLSSAAHTLYGGILAAIVTAVAYTVVLVSMLAVVVVASRAVSRAREVTDDAT